MNCWSCISAKFNNMEDETCLVLLSSWVQVLFPGVSENKEIQTKDPNMEEDHQKAFILKFDIISIISQL